MGGGRVRLEAHVDAAGEDVVDTAVGAIMVSDPAMAEGFLPPDSSAWLTLPPRGLSLLAGAPAAQATP